MSTPALQIKDLHAWYGESHILHGVDLTVNRGEVVTLLITPLLESAAD